MKKQAGTLLTKFTDSRLADLTKEVKETVAVGFIIPFQKSLTAADLWNIRRQGKRMVQRRFIF